MDMACRMHLTLASLNGRHLDRQRIHAKMYRLMLALGSDYETTQMLSLGTYSSTKTHTLWVKKGSRCTVIDISKARQ